MINGVTHNIGFGKSILKNEAYLTGNYSTAFIPTYYPKGFTGDNLSKGDHSLLAVVGHKIKNYFASRGKASYVDNKDIYLTIGRIRDQAPVDYKISQDSDSQFTVTDLSTG